MLYAVLLNLQDEIFQSLFIYICSMKYFLVLVILLVNFQLIEAQDLVSGQKQADSIVDNRYREDQFYASVTYNLLGNKPDGVSQSGFSGGFHFGFIRDMPINERRNLAVGVGLGLSTNSYNQTLLISEDTDGFNFSVIDSDATFSKNKFSTYLVEMPIEFRWRTSDATTYDFWRIYTGIKISYLFYNTSKYNGEPDDIKLSGIDNFNALQYGLTLSAGYSKVNFHIYYALNDIFDTTTKVDGSTQNVGMNAIKVGLIFYIL